MKRENSSMKTRLIPLICNWNKKYIGGEKGPTIVWREYLPITVRIVQIESEKTRYQHTNTVHGVKVKSFGLQV